MNLILNDEAMNAIIDARRNDIIDYIYFRRNYFPSGFSEEPYYNYNYMIIISMIGKMYNNKKKVKNSNYHNGIAYIANELGISKCKVKSLRKKFKTIGGYQFKTPYDIAEVIKIITILLKQNEDEEVLKKFVSQHKGELYRDILIRVQKDAIDISANETGDYDIKEVQSALDDILEKCGE